jgi:HlyD family secretion protein
MTATLRIITDQRRDVLRVPAAALRWRPTGNADAPAASPIEQALEQLSDLTPQQREEVAAAQAEFRDRMAAAPDGADARRQVLQTARQRLMSRLNAVLTPDQRAQLAERRTARGQSGTLWVSEDGVPRAVRVRTGLSDGSLVELVSGDVVQGAEVILGTERRSAPAQPTRRLF